MIFIANPLPGTELYKQSRLNGFIKKDLTSSDYFIAIKANQKSIINTPEFNKKIIFLTLKKELNTTKYSVHNIAQPMFWNNNKKAWSRAKSVFPRMSNRKVLWTWIEEK